MDVNTLGAVTRTTSTGFLSNLVQRESLGWPTCMPIYLLFDLKNGDMAATFTIHLMDSKSYMVIRLATFALTYSDLERSNRGQAYFRGL